MNKPAKNMIASKYKNIQDAINDYHRRKSLMTIQLKSFSDGCEERLCVTIQEERVKLSNEYRRKGTDYWLTAGQLSFPAADLRKIIGFLMELAT